ncbi:MAG: lipid-A-disaccharide synthase, partial [Porticoccus sp.]
KVKYVALPNLLADEPLVPEFLEENATIKNLSGAVMRFFEHPEQTKNLQKRFIAIHESLKCGGNEAAAKALVALIGAP